MPSTKKETSQGDILKELTELGPIILDRPFTREEFKILAARYPDLQIERERNGKIHVMTPVKGGSGERESIVLIFLGIWRYQTGKGKTFSASTGIELADGAIKSPDCAWLSPEKCAIISPEELENEYLRIAPDFVAEVRSKTDSLSRLKRKMTDAWIRNGVRLAWLIDPYQEKAFIYRADGSVEVVEGFAGKKLSGEEIMPGMELPLDEMRVGT